jgi:cytidylate kinase
MDENSLNSTVSDAVHRLSPAIIAVDGPAASGKSTMGYLVAEALDFLLFDTGVMYRAVTWAALDRSVPISDKDAVSRLAETALIDIAPPDSDESDGRQCTVLVDDVDVTWLIRSPEVDQNVSTVSAYPRVREALSTQQRRIGEKYGSGKASKAGIVMVGRDIGTVVLPTAGLKIYMDATAEERARRRHLELEQRGKNVPYDQILADIIQRDERDSGRALSPLRPADDAVLVDTSDMAPGEVVERILRLAEGQPS